MPIKLINYLKKGKRPYIILFTIAGGAGGFLYWHFIGCNTGTCPIRSVWYYSTLYGIILGYLVGDLVSGLIIKRKRQDSSGQ